MTSFIFIFLTLLEYTLVLNGKFRMYKINSSKELRRKKQIRKRFGEVTTPRGIVVCSQVLFIRRKHFRCQRQKRAPREKCPCLELFWFAFSRTRTDYSVRIGENVDQNDSEYGQFLHSGVISLRGVFTTLANIYDGAFLFKKLTGL